jgi:quercetin dioxygenase-like cupin family protein
MAVEKAQVGHVAELAQFSTEGFGRRRLAGTERFLAVLAALEDGQQIPPHAPPLDLVMTIVEGAGQVMVGDAVRSVSAGDVVVVPAVVVRGLRAIGGRLLAVNAVSPPPGPDDHDHVPVPWPEEVAEPSR